MNKSKVDITKRLIKKGLISKTKIDFLVELAIQENEKEVEDIKKNIFDHLSSLHKDFNKKEVVDKVLNNIEKAL